MVFPNRSPRFFAVSAGLLLAGSAVMAQAPADQMERGSKLFVERCQLCHQASGQGAPPVYPPVAGSDWFKGKPGERARLIKVLCEGLSGPIEVNGQKYTNVMPAQMLDDAQAADVLSFVGNSWGSASPALSAEEVREARTQSNFKTFADLQKSASFQPLPAAPVGWKLRELVQLPEFCTRMAGDGSTKNIYVLAQNGSIYALDYANAAVTPLIRPGDYLDTKRGEFVAMGCTLGPDGKLWMITNQMIKEGVPIYMSEVIIWRSTAAPNGIEPLHLEPWFKTTYPRGVGGMNHGVSHLAFGADKKLYVASGSRTDGGEISADPHYYKGNEVDLTACVWRLDPEAAKPEIEVIARGIRNAYAFAWDGSGNLFTFANGPDFSAPEEMDFIEAGHHYGFPYQFSDWPVKPGFPYAHTPPPPAGITFTPPVVNLGPAAGGSADKPLSTFDAHSSPAGSIWCGDAYPEPLRNSFLVTRFGNLLGAPASPEDVGFDVLTVRPSKKEGGGWQARIRTVLAPLGRPIDVLPVGRGRVLILEYTRPTNFKEGTAWLPGRVLELAPE